MAFRTALALPLDEMFVYLDGFDPQALRGSEGLLFPTVPWLPGAAQAVDIFGRPCVPYATLPHQAPQEWVAYQPH